MKNFIVNDHYSFVCESKKTRRGFNHYATLCLNGSGIASDKACYLNRTWESYEFQSVMRGAVGKAKISTVDKDLLAGYVDSYREDNAFAGIAAAAGIADLLFDNAEDRAQWKLRMMKAGLGQHISVPADWEHLPVEEQERRLNAALGALK